jgi:putative tricarboxylic transport membrane protein
MNVDSSLSLWRAVVAPPALAQDQIAYWERALRAMTRTEEWKAQLQQEFLTPKFLNHVETVAFLGAEEKRFRAHFDEFGLLKQKQ